MMAIPSAAQGAPDQTSAANPATLPNPSPDVVARVQAHYTPRLIDHAITTIGTFMGDLLRESPHTWAANMHQPSSRWEFDRFLGRGRKLGTEQWFPIHFMLARSCRVSEWHALLALALAVGFTAEQIGAPADLTPSERTTT